MLKTNIPSFFSHASLSGCLYIKCIDILYYKWFEPRSILLVGEYAIVRARVVLRSDRLSVVGDWRFDNLNGRLDHLADFELDFRLGCGAPPPKTNSGSAPVSHQPHSFTERSFYWHSIFGHTYFREIFFSLRYQISCEMKISTRKTRQIFKSFFYKND